MRTKAFLFIVGLVCLVSTSCTSVYDAHRVDPNRLSQEGTVVFVRPTEHTVFGTKSIRDYVEITFENSSYNAANLLKVDVGLRARGGQHFWDLHGPNFHLSVKTTFLQDPPSSSSVPVYETNWQTVRMLRGSTFHYKAICPVPEGHYYQVVISEQLVR